MWKHLWLSLLGTVGCHGHPVSRSQLWHSMFWNASDSSPYKGAVWLKMPLVPSLGKLATDPQDSTFRSYSIAVWFRSLCSTYVTSQCSLTKHVYVSWNARHSPKQCVDMEPFNLLNNSMPQYCLPRYFIERIEAQRGETRTPQSSTEPWFILSWYRASRTAR